MMNSVGLDLTQSRPGGLRNNTTQRFFKGIKNQTLDSTMLSDPDHSANVVEAVVGSTTDQMRKIKVAEPPLRQLAPLASECMYITKSSCSI
ncbi:hypothetical protein TNCV_3285271 [Trichonephila clavipes]|nr:hypothetical protein TNCV_3285271 [Trichonephila clavipes]